MAKFKHFAFLLLLSLVLVSATTALVTKTDPELQQCKHQCTQQQGFDKKQKQECQDKCEEYYRQKHGGEEQQREPQKQYEQCRKQCQRESQPGQGQQQQQKCEQKCLEQLKEQQDKGQGDPIYEGETEKEGQQQQGQGADNNPYVFDDQHFTTSIRTQHGRVRLLKKFSDHSKLLRGLKYYRLAVLEAGPRTFVLPKHCDTETIIFVNSGDGTISLLLSGKRQSFNVRQGDILRIPSGTTTYTINRSKNEKLVIYSLLVPVSIPGDVQTFFGPGGKNPESFFGAFSKELLQAAFNTEWDRLQSMFAQNKGAIQEASEEQIRALTHHGEGGIWPFGESKGTVNIFNQRPTKSNEYGELREIDQNDYEQLQDVNVGLSFANITKGGMENAFYNSRATKILIIRSGKGYLEMVCPHLAESGESQEESQGGSGGSPGQQGQSSSGPSYQQVSAQLRPKMVVVVPVGHPIILVASKDQNLEALCFEVNAKGNERFPLAGRKNIWNLLEREAKELAFGASAREVEQILKSQDQEWFTKGPRQLPQQQHEGRADA